jgi:hypothetical protein
VFQQVTLPHFSLITAPNHEFLPSDIVGGLPQKNVVLTGAVPERALSYFFPKLSDDCRR